MWRSHEGEYILIGKIIKTVFRFPDVWLFWLRFGSRSVIAGSTSSALLKQLEGIFTQYSEYSLCFIAPSCGFFYGESAAKINCTCLGLNLQLVSTVI